LPVFTLLTKDREYKIPISKEGTSIHTVGTCISEVLNKELAYTFINVNNSSGSYGSIKLLLEGKVDFAITQNVLDIYKKLNISISKKETELLLNNLYILRKEAFNNLNREKLTAN